MHSSISKSELIALRPCELSARLALFGDKDRLTLRQAIKLGVTVRDLLWVISRSDPNSLSNIAIFAEDCARAARSYAAANAAHAAHAAHAAYAANAAHTAYAAHAANSAANAAASAACISTDSVELKRQLDHLIELFG